MSGLPPTASEIATAKFSCWERIPSDVGYAFNLNRSEPRAKLRSVPIATCRYLSKVAQVAKISVGAQRRSQKGHVVFRKKCADSLWVGMSTARHRTKFLIKFVSATRCIHHDDLT